MVGFAAQWGTSEPGVPCPVLCGSPTSSISCACSLTSYLCVAPGCPHPTPPARVGPGRQDAAGVPGGEAQPVAGRELLLPALLLVSPHLGCDTPKPQGQCLTLCLAGAESRGSGQGNVFRWLLVASLSTLATGVSGPSGVRQWEGVAGPRRETWWWGSGSPCLAARLVITLLWPRSRRGGRSRRQGG